MAEILFTEARDYLLDKDGNHIPSSFLQDKVLGIFMAPHWTPMLLMFIISRISEIYYHLQKEGKPICFIYIALNRSEQLISRFYKNSPHADLEIDKRPDDECFRDVLSKLPHGWLAVPLEDSEIRYKVVETYYKEDVFSAAFVGPDGCLNSDQGLTLLRQWGAQGYPFHRERILQLEQEKEERMKNQTLETLLAHEDRDFLIRFNSTDTVKVSELEGKTVGLYFSAFWCPAFPWFTPMLVSVYTELKEKNEDFEVVFVSSDNDQESFDKYMQEMPWLAVPFSDVKTRELLSSWFQLPKFPALVILDPDGKTISVNGLELLHNHGADGYPYTKERLEQLKQEKEDRNAAQTLESLLVTAERDYIESKFQQVKVASLVDKTVGLYFAGHWSPICKNFTPQLKLVYDENSGEEFEIIFISCDEDEMAFNDSYESMPWLALPYSDRLTKNNLARYFKVEWLPAVIIIGPDGKTVTMDGMKHVADFGADAFPFTQERISELKPNRDENKS